MNETKDVTELLKSLANIVTQYNQEVNDKNDNIFVILNKETDERTHCRILCYLINKYWESFKHDLVEIFKRVDIDISNQELKTCYCEHQCDPLENCVACPNKKGFVDIYLETENYIFPIEVKVGAKDQYLQLIRYINDLSKDTKKTVVPIYLTRTGYEASDKSKTCGYAECANRKNKKCQYELSEKQYIQLSSKDLEQWLKNCVENSTDDVASRLAKDYLDVIGDNKMSKKLVDEILKSEDSFKAAQAIINLGADKFVSKIMSHLYDKLNEYLAKDGYMLVEPTSKDEPLIYDSCAQRLGYKDGELLFSLCVSTNLYVRKGINLQNWSYITKDWFEGNTSGREETSKSNVINAKTLSDAKIPNPIVEWYFTKDEDKKQKRIENLANSIIKYLQRDEK